MMCRGVFTFSTMSISFITRTSRASRCRLFLAGWSLRLSPAESSSQRLTEKANREPWENVYLILLCPSVQSPCSIPLITVWTVSTSNPGAHTSPEQQKPPNSSVRHLHGAVDQSEHSASQGSPTGSRFVQHRPEQSSEYRGTRPTLVYFIVRLSNCGLLTEPGHNPNQPNTETDLRREGPNMSPFFLRPLHLHVSVKVGWRN